MSKPDTPMMRQYLEVKATQPGCLLLMRMGDFYEAFLDDAKELSRVCGVALTSRNKDGPEPIPMAGVPHQSLRLHLPKLLAAGVRVAVMDQLEDPATAKGLVKRGLTRVITAGTLIDEDALDAGSANYLVAITGIPVRPANTAATASGALSSSGAIGIAALDVSTGRFTVEDAADAESLAHALARLAPAEVVLPDALARDDAALAQLRALLAPATPAIQGVPAFAWKPADARRLLCERLRVAALDGFGIGEGDDHLAAAAAAALRYAEANTAPLTTEHAERAPLSHVRAIVRLAHGEHLVIDATCRRNLDLVRSAREGSRAGTLLAAIDRTRTAPGARLLAEWLVRPLARPDAILARQAGVAALVERDDLRRRLREALASVYDLERLLARIATGRAHARDLVHLAGSLHAAQLMATYGEKNGDDSGAPSRHGLATPVLAAAFAALCPAPGLADAIAATLVDAPPLSTADGGMVRDGVDAELDELRALGRDAATWLSAYEAREAAATGLRLKVVHSSIHGYAIEIGKAHSAKVPAHFVRRQTLVNAERFITSELKEFEDRALHASDRARARELALFAALRDRAEADLPSIQAAAGALALLDAAAALAELARLNAWCRPEIDDGLALRITGGRHPVVEQALGAGRFVANDAVLDATARGPERDPEADSVADDPTGPSLALITGPNMAGKSTYIRQIALIAILAQIGAYVPATAARLGVIDRIFTRVGAGDELARGQSTFMVEMAETAAILHHATRRSLVVLDEVGRGTSTFDGLSLAWAIVEHLHDRIGCRTLFATHYHELTDLAAERRGIANCTVAVAESDDEVAFLHRIVPGAATKSYGIHVARLAGVPDAVVRRARDVLATLETLNVGLAEHERPLRRAAESSDPTSSAGPVQLTLFTPSTSPTLTQLRALDVDALTPRQALDLLARLRDSARHE